MEARAGPLIPRTRRRSCSPAPSQAYIGDAAHRPLPAATLDALMRPWWDGAGHPVQEDVPEALLEPLVAFLRA